MEIDGSDKSKSRRGQESIEQSRPGFLATNPWASRILDHGQTPPAPLWTSFFIRPAATPRADFETTGSPSTKPMLALGATKIKRHPRYPCELYDPGPCVHADSPVFRQPFPMRRDTDTLRPIDRALSFSVSLLRNQRVRRKARDNRSKRLVYGLLLESRIDMSLAFIESQKDTKTKSQPDKETGKSRRINEFFEFTKARVISEEFSEGGSNVLKEPIWKIEEFRGELSASLEISKDSTRDNQDLEEIC
ncbi:hypothetical protein WN48_07117 [Eufriesea mexicana]|uniref:Uncharacterized protein n=1 Tax=Eufriesea mexicana TaxID=516756 RepID=A0A310SNM5_9HYME|nr:hypothetical protein WN48_07117 [Eufriesea mexicana]